MQAASENQLQAGNAHNGGITMSASIRDLVGIIINRTSRTWRTKLDERLSHLGLTQARWLVLMHLSRMNGKALQKDLAVSVGVEGPTLVRVLDGLERMGLVERVGVEGDRRARRICLTPKADSVINDILNIGTKLRVEALTGISDADLEVFYRVTEVILANLLSASAK